MDNATDVVKISFCGCNPPGCPSIEVSTDEVIIKDDFNGACKMSREEFGFLAKRYLEMGV